MKRKPFNYEAWPPIAFLMVVVWCAGLFATFAGWNYIDTSAQHARMMAKGLEASANILSLGIKSWFMLAIMFGGIAIAALVCALMKALWLWKDD